MFSSRPINTGMVGLRYNLFGRSSASIEAVSYFGKFYAAGQLKLRAYLSTKAPVYIEPVFTLHRWDYFRSFSTFFDEVKPSFVVMRETWGGANIGTRPWEQGPPSRRYKTRRDLGPLLPNAEFQRTGHRRRHYVPALDDRSSTGAKLTEPKAAPEHGRIIQGNSPLR